MINDYIIELPRLKWDKEFFINDLIKTQTSRRWRLDNGLYAYSSGEFIIGQPTLSEELEKLVNSQLHHLKLNFKDRQWLYMVTRANSILKPHFDTDRPASLNIPLLGNMADTPIRYHTGASLQSKDTLFTHVYTCPTIVNTKIWHSAVNRTTEDRHILSVSLYNTWNELIEIFSNPDNCEFNLT